MVNAKAGHEAKLELRIREVGGEVLTEERLRSGTPRIAVDSYTNWLASVKLNELLVNEASVEAGKRMPRSSN